MNKDNLGDRIKTIYEDAHRIILPGRMPVLVRNDGVSFHRLTRYMDKPFDARFIFSMIAATKYLCENVQNCVLGYTQSDEISLVLINYKRLNTSSWFNNNLQKIASVSASMATLAFNRELSNYYPDKEGYFDGRAFVVPREDICNALLFRQQDSSRNSVQMLGHYYFSQKQLHGLSNFQVQDKLMLEAGINWDHLNVMYKRGTCIVKKGNGWVVDCDVPIFSQHPEYINNLLTPEVNQLNNESGDSQSKRRE
jgi:tRNA(His) 5'-end guanylyltransferase